MFSRTTISHGVAGSRKAFQRHVSYTLPKIPLLEDLRVNQQDFKGLMSNDSLNQLWFTRGEGFVKELNELLVENQITPPNNLQELISLTINKPEFHKIYTNSSLLYNLQFFFESLNESTVSYEFKQLDESVFFKNPDINEPTVNLPQDEGLTSWLVASFGSIGEFKNLLLNSAKSIKGDGVTWLVAQPNVSESSLRSHGFNNSLNENNEPKYTKLSVMNTYNAGTIDDSIRSGQLLKLQQQKAAKEALQAESGEEGSSLEDKLNESKNENYLSSIGDAELNYLFSDKKIVPLLAIDASLRNYLLDYGIFGKAEYLENVWNCINWNTVKERSPPRFIANFTID